MAAVPYDVAEAFCMGRRKRRGEFLSTSAELYSYGLKLAHRDPDGSIHWDVDPDEARKISVTTAHHVNATRAIISEPGAERYGATS